MIGYGLVQASMAKGRAVAVRGFGPLYWHYFPPGLPWRCNKDGLLMAS